ncbi:MAG: peptidase T, partial [Planctomycetaceae bacterium]
MINQSRLLDRFLRYIQIGTAADPSSQTYPSSSGQWELGRVLLRELLEMGAADVELDENGLVWATVPANTPASSPTVALIAHMDTSPEAPGVDVRPQVIECYEGGDITLPSGATLTAANSPSLAKLVGKTLVTTDGGTLLGGDDKAGIAIIMEVAQHLIEQPHLPHGSLRLLFTCDEEIGHGTDRIDLQKLRADVAYTIDGGGAGMLDVETFSADAMRVIFIGHNIHPAIAKDQMINALRGAGDFVNSLPKDRCSPETTQDREGFIHPHDIRGGVGRCEVDLILRSFDERHLDEFATHVIELANRACDRLPGLRVEFARRRQYRNLAEGLRKLPDAVALAERAFANLGRPCELAIVRGGTDGSQLTEKGLPTPNLSSGQHNIHSVLEFVCVEEMVESAEH